MDNGVALKCLGNKPETGFIKLMFKSKRAKIKNPRLTPVTASLIFGHLNICFGSFLVRMYIFFRLKTIMSAH